MAREKVEYIIPTSLDDIPDGATYQKITIDEATRLASCDENAEVNPTGLEMQTAIVGLPDAERVLVESIPTVGQKHIYGVAVSATGAIEADQDTIAES